MKLSVICAAIPDTYFVIQFWSRDVDFGEIFISKGPHHLKGGHAVDQFQPGAPIAGIFANRLNQEGNGLFFQMQFHQHQPLPSIGEIVQEEVKKEEGERKTHR